MLNMLQDAVVARLEEAEIRADVLDEMPYSVWPIEELEVGMQIINTVRIQDFFDGKINDAEMNQWEWHAYMTKRFPDHYPAKKLFAEVASFNFNSVGFALARVDAAAHAN